MSVEQNNQSSIISFCFNMVIIKQTTSVDAHKVKRPFLPVALYAKKCSINYHCERKHILYLFYKF